MIDFREMQVKGLPQSKLGARVLQNGIPSTVMDGYRVDRK